MRNTIRTHAESFKGKLHVDQVVLEEMLQRLEDPRALTKEEGVPEHFGAFFVPVHKRSRSIYLGHHIKADDWIPPGGHIDKGEVPLETVRREFIEELKFYLTDETIELFNFSKKILSPPKPNCAMHFDIWHAVYMKERHEFIFDRGEFYNAGWFSAEDAAKMTKKNPNYQKVLADFISQLQ